MGRSIILGVVGDSAAGKTTLTRGLVRVLGEDNVTHVCIDDYHRYDRRQRAERNITPLHPDCNHMDIMAQHLGHLRAREPFLKPVYQHHDGTFGPLVRVDPSRFSVVEGLLGYYNAGAPRACSTCAIYLDPPEELRRKWKVQRDCSRRGYTTDQVLSELDRREPDSEAFIRPQRAPRRHRRLLPAERPTRPGASRRRARRSARLAAAIPTSLGVVGESAEAGSCSPSGDGELRAPHPRPAPAASAPRRSRRRSGSGLHFASHLRAGAARRVHDRHRPPPLRVARADPAAVLYHLFTATASAALDGIGARRPEREPAAT